MDNDLFKFTETNQRAKIFREILREQFSSLLDTIQKEVPESRELSLCKTKLEEASFYAMKAVSKTPKYTEKQ